ncbi:MAG: carboxylesterase/lipase family protein [Lysobacterales bacterium]
MRAGPQTLAAICACLLASPGWPAATAADGLVRTRAGLVRGATVDGIQRFLGMRYGADTAQRRFQAPLPAPAWKGVRSATAYGPWCPQVAEVPEGQAVSEDCLRLNLWTPAVDDSVRRPVLVYFHGGAYSNGAVTEPPYDGAALSRRGNVVVVTVHHRLNGFGYLYLGDYGERYRDSGNAGMLDLILALRWVHENIARFGGDPARVTIFGQSGGGAKCATLMAMPAARGLFQRVWTMSGQQLSGRTLAHARETTLAVLTELELTPETLQQLESMSLAQLSAAMRPGTWTPVVDGHALPRDPFEPAASPLSRDIPMVLGNTLDETTSLIGSADPATFDLGWEQIAPKLRQHVAAFIGDLDPAEIVSDYRRWYPNATPAQVFFSASTAARSWKGMVLESERRADQGGPTWIYHLNWRTPLDGGRWGAPHTLDLPLVFGNIAASPYTAADAVAAKSLSDSMMAALLAFARDGDPNAGVLPGWPRFELEQRQTMIFDQDTRVESDPRGQERRLFAPIRYVQPGS